MYGLAIAAFGMCTSVPLVYVGYALAAVGALLQPQRLAPFLVGWPWAVAFSLWISLNGFLGHFEQAYVPPGWAFCWPAMSIWALAASNPRRIVWAWWSLALAATLTASLAVVQFSVGYRNDLAPWRVGSDGERGIQASGFYSHWIRFGDAMAFASLWLVAWYQGTYLLRVRGWWWVGMVAIAMVGVTATFMSGARGAFGAFIVGAWIVAATLLPWRRLMSVTIAMVAVLGLAGILAWPTHGERIRDAFAGQDGRTYIWHTAWETFCRYPITGVGSRAYDQAALETVALGLSPAGPEGANMGNAHNSFLSLLVLYGVPGFVLWCGWLVTVVRHIWRRRHRHPAAWPIVLATLGVFIIGSLTEDLAAYAASRFQLFFGLAMALGCTAFGQEITLKSAQNAPVRSIQD